MTRTMIEIERLATPQDRRRTLEADVREGLAATPKQLPPKYFYDGRGSELFEQITRLPEYYLTRCETAILEAHADELVDAFEPDELVEIGSGSSRKTRLLLEALLRRGGRRYVAFDVSEPALRTAAESLTATYPRLEVHGIVADFEAGLHAPPRSGRRLLAFLGSTLGNFEEEERVGFLRRMADMLVDGDALLLGVDLVKDRAVLEAAYDDAAGVTAEFNRNVLHVLNRELDGDLPVDAFEHHALWNERRARIEMWLRAGRPVQARLAALDLSVRFARGEEMRTEISCKFTRESVTAALTGAGLRLERWLPDGGQAFALAVAVPATARSGG